MEFVLHVRNEYDYRFICDNREELFNSIKAVYFLQMNDNLPIYAVSENLKTYATSKKDVKNDLIKMPPEKYRQYFEDVYEPISTKPAASNNNTSTLTTESDDDVIPANCTAKAAFSKTGDTESTLSDFVIKKVIGRGSFGKVFLVQKKDTGAVYAMKSLRKDVILDYDQLQSTKLEKDILLQANHPFLVGMNYVFMTDHKIFFVMRFVRGGELFMHLRQS